MTNELQQIGPGRYAFNWETPWGQPIPAEMIVATRRGWRERPEARDGRWSAYPVGPVVIAIRLVGGVPTRPPLLQSWPVPAEWN